MSLPKYPKYKDSGVAWLGEVPTHWKFKPVWALFRRMKRTGFGGEQLLSVYRDYGVVPKASRDDNNNRPSDDLSLYQLVRPGDLVVNKMKAWQGSVAVSEYQGIVSPAYFVLEAIHAESSRYLHYLFRSAQYITGYFSLSKGIRVGQWDLEPQQHSRMPVAIPPDDEQGMVAVFLDCETSRIDALIAEQEKLLSLLAEKRQATISHAVTKGLSQDVPMKDSGLAWLGEVPEHWGLTRIKFASVFTTSGPRGWSGRVSQEGHIFVQSGDLNDGLNIDFVNATRVVVGDDAEALRTKLQIGDVVVCITGARTGNVALCMGLSEPAFVNQHLCLVRPLNTMVPRFLAFVLKSRIGQLQFALFQYGLKQGLSLENVREVVVPCTSLEEQVAIVEFLDAETARLDALTAEATRAIELLKERRTALISAAVTGKIDVRGLVTVPEPA